MKNCILIIIFGLITLKAYSFDYQTIRCESERMSKAVILKDSSVTFIDKEDESQRAIASSMPSRSQFLGNGVNHILQYEDKKYYIHIADVKHFNDVDDYIEIKSNEGHNIIYPIKCNVR